MSTKGTILVVAICITIISWPFGVWWGYSTASKQGYKDGIGSAESYITRREMNAYDSGVKYGYYIGKLNWPEPYEVRKARRN